MANVFIEARPKGRPEGSPIDGYVAEDHAALSRLSKTQSIGRNQVDTVHVARVRYLNDRRMPIAGGKSEDRHCTVSYTSPLCILNLRPDSEGFLWSHTSLTRLSNEKSEHLEKEYPMDDYNKQSDTGVAAARAKISDTATNVKEKITDMGRNAADSIDGSRESAAGALDGTASSLHSSADQISSAAHTAADKLQTAAHSTADKVQATADYVRNTDVKGMVDDLTGVVKRYPGQALAAAAALGFLVARGLKSND